MPKYLDDTGLATNIQIAKDTFMPKMTVDSSPTANSTNLVTSGGVKTALNQAVTGLGTAIEGKEDVFNKVTSLSSSSTNTQYPSAKCVYDGLAGKQSTLVSGTNIKTINNESLLGSGNITINADTSACELLANKVTSISSSSTDTQYPSAKAVYDIIGDVETLINAL